MTQPGTHPTTVAAAVGRSMDPIPRQAGWVVRGATVQGNGHLGRGTSGQDSFDWAPIPARQGGQAVAWVLAVADGAGSRRRSAQGASLAVGLAVDIATAEFGAVGRPDDAEACKSLMSGVFDKLRAAFHKAVEAIPSAAPANFATTLTVALIADPFIGLASVGDGFTVVRTGRGESVRFHVVDYEIPDSAEAGQTSSGSSFLTSSDVLERRRVYVIPNGDVTGILLATDGMENSLVEPDKYGALRAYPDTLHDIMRYFGDDAGGTPGEIIDFLRSPEVASHTRDDKTLLLAVRR
jgi:hypothetical protein